MQLTVTGSWTVYDQTELITANRGRALESEKPGFKSYFCSVTLGKLPNLSEPHLRIRKMGKAMPTL